MPIEPWFPLAIYYTDVENSAEQKDSLVSTILELEEKGKERRIDEKTAWTGDFHGVGQLQEDPRFAWVTNQIENHVLKYLDELGMDLDKMDLYIQRAWPVISRPNQSVGPHAHYTSHISAVYYVAVPENDTPESGSFVIHNRSNMNEFIPNIGGEHTDAIKKWNPFNYKMGSYSPKEGRLLIFPSRQTHGVALNKTKETRISLSFDIVITSAEDGDSGLHEYLSPPPSMWKKISKIA
jgi:uncharacterized protein (TIGR02466 family)